MNSESLHAANEMKVPKEPNTISTGNCPLIKPSLSMTSLPPDENSRNCGEVLKAKLRDERPYNSLKKKRISQRDSWRHSWGSGHSHHSHSSCSLYSNTTGTGLSSGKDDFWAALQTNYNYIMDTNLMDTCREARCELECETRTVVNTPECCAKMLQPNYSDGTPEDVKGLRRWLREKEDTLAKAPSLFEATHLTTEQLRELLAEHSVLYYDIVSHARVVNACVRSCEKEVNSCCTTDTLYSSSTCTKQLKKSIVSNCEYRATEDNLKGLERRYHLLYLKAIEVQCLFEGLLGKRNSSTVLNRTSSTETDDEPASKVPRYTDVKAPAKHFKGDNFEASSCNRSDIISDELISEGRSRTHLGDQKKTNRRYRHYSKLYTSYREPIGVDFDADSEGSEFDNEVLNNEHKRYLGVQNQFCQKICANKNKNNQLVSNNTMESKFLTERQANLIASKETLLVTNITNSREVASRSTANATIVNLCKTSASTIASAKKRHRIVDISKFNRSNRKSKNCAIFYFKHLDTDNENFGLSSQGSDINKSADPSSDEGWLYSRDCVDGINEVTYDSDKENYTEIANNCSVKLSPSVGSDKSQTHRDVMYSNKSTIMDQVVTSECDSTSIVSDELKDDGKSILKCTPSTVKLTDGNNCELSECGKSPVKMKISSPVNVDTSQDSIRQLVLNADNLIRDDQLKTPTKTHTIVKISSTVKKREIVMSGPNLQKVQEWLEYQPRKEGDTSVSQPTTDCEASGEYTESDSSNVRDSDTSDGPSDSVATCMQTGGSNSQCTSTEKIGGSAEPITHSGSNLSLGYGKVIRRTNKRNCDRPWSVSCLSQLTENDKINGENVTANQGLTTHSISESALHVLSIASTKNHSDSSPVIRTSGSKGSLRRRKPRKRKVTNKRSDSGSDGLIQKLFEQQSISDNMNIIEDITEALSMISLPKHVSGQVKTTSLLETGDEGLAKPNFKIGPVTNPSFPLINESKLGSLAALANYMNEDQAGNYTGTEDHSSFSEQAWDNFQEKYNSENYSEGMDSDAARRLLEFGDDYRNFLDSQSDCCSSLSAANNLDSFSPPQMDSLNTNENKLPQPPPVSTIDHIRRRRALELEYERRREIKKKNSNDELRGNRSPNESSSSINNASVNNERMVNRSFADVVRRLDFRSNSPPHHLKKTSESESNINRRRKSEESSTIRRRISRASDKALKISSLVTSSSNTSSDEEKEVKSLLVQSRKRLEDTNALKIRSHLLRPEDYNEILTTCRDNIDCLGSVLHGASGTVLSTARSNETRDLLSSWENLFGWSENAAAIRKMREEMMVLRNALGRLGKLTCDLDSEASIQLSIEELKGEKIQLQTFRTNMLHLNASVHSWLTREEMRTACNQENNANETQAVEEASGDGNIINSKIEISSTEINTATQSEKEYFINLRNEVSDMYCTWDEADVRVSSQLETLTNSLIAWRQLEMGLSEFHQVLFEDRGALQGLEGVLDGAKANAAELANNVKIVAKLLSEKVTGRQQVAMIASELGEQGRQFHTIVASSNGSLSDSGISDGGTTSDGGLSERERRLVVLRRLAKQLENALAPGSEALRSIAARMESAELELKTLQNTCRDLIVRTSVSQQNVGCLGYESGSNSSMKFAQKENTTVKKSPTSGRKTKRRASNKYSANVERLIPKKLSGTVNVKTTGSGDPDDPQDDPLQFTVSDDDLDRKRGWTWRIARIALPVQVAIITLLCAACLMEPHCCDTLNNFSMSFTPQLRYIRGPPPI